MRELADHREFGSGRFSGRAIVVTGAASGMGKSIARRLREEGAMVDRKSVV
jgi:NADP-dependent 3-hydroxy acid dehydrogenase YdfG